MNPTTSFAVLQWMDQLRRLRTERRCNCPDFLRPYHFVTLALAMSKWHAAELQIPAKLQDYAARMRLWEALGLPAPVSVAPFIPEGHHLPLVRLVDREAVPDTASALADIVATFGADGETRDAVYTSLAEIMENCFAHAAVSDPLKGLACAQSWPDQNLVQIAIADGGIGVRASLQGNPALAERLQSENSCEMATQFGVTSKPQLGHAGYGLALTRQLLEKASGRLIVMSGSEWVQVKAQRCTTGQLRAPLEGTLAVLEWRTGQPLRLRDVYSSWPLPSGFTDDDFDF